jgi:hypothetical protein
MASQKWWLDAVAVDQRNLERVKAFAGASHGDVLLAALTVVASSLGMELGRIADALEAQNTQVTDGPVPTPDV